MNRESERAMARAIAELRRHGGSKADVAQMVQQFKKLDDDKAETESTIIPE